MPGLFEIQTYFFTWYTNLLELWMDLSRPGFAEVLQQGADSISGNADSFLAEAILNGLASLILFFFGADASLFHVLLGSSFAFFISYTVLVWLVRIIP